MDKTPIILLGMVIGGCFLFLLAHKWEQKIQLSEGSNEVVYKGEARPASAVFASIEEYLVVAYYLDPVVNDWVQVIGGTLMVPNGLYTITVSQACIWSF